MSEKMRKPRAKNFKAWFMANLKQYAYDIANNGADMGYPFITYDSDAGVIFDTYADEIIEKMEEKAANIGMANWCDMAAGFARQDMLCTWTSTKTLLVWYMCEEVSRELVDSYE